MCTRDNKLLPLENMLAFLEYTLMSLWESRSLVYLLFFSIISYPQVNGCDLREATHDQAVAIIRNSTNPVLFMVHTVSPGSRVSQPLPTSTTPRRYNSRVRQMRGVFDSP